MHLPLTGIGASAQAYLPPIANSAEAEGVIPEQAEVDNAVGAIIVGLSQPLKLALALSIT